MSFSKDTEKEIDKLKSEAKKNSSKIKPFHIPAKISELMNLSDIEEACEQINELQSVVPAWYTITAEIEGKNLQVYKYFNHDIMGDEFIKTFHLVRYPKLLEGAVYEPARGAWRYFGKNEMQSFTEKEAVSQLQLWGVYDIKYPGQVSRYVKQKTYDVRYTGATPFEKSKPELVPFANGTYNLLTDEMKPHRPENYILTSYSYDLDTSKQATPATDKFFADFFEDGALFMQQFIGYTFYRSHTPAQDMVFLQGDGGEGKSSFLNLMTDCYITPENRVSISPQSLTKDKFSTVELLGKSVNVCGDIDDDFINATGILKQITGGDAVRGEFKGIQGFSFTSYAKNIFSMNGFFHFSDLSPGFADRLTVVPITIGNQRKEDANFWKSHDLTAIKKEAPSFAYKCIQEFKKIFDGNRASFTYSKKMNEVKEQWLYDNDRMGQFLLEACKIHLGDDRGEIATTVYTEYKGFCSQNGYIPKSAQELTKYLHRKGIPKLKNRRGFKDGNTPQWRYIGLELLITFLRELDDIA